MNSEISLDERWRVRLKQAIADKGMSLRQFSLSIGKGEGYVKGLLHKKHDPSLSTIAAICDALNVPIDSLISGTPLDQDNIEFLRAFALLGERDRSTVRALIDALSKSSDD